MRGHATQPTTLLDAKEVAERLGCARSTVYSLALPYVKLGRRTVRWRARDLEEETTVEDTPSNEQNTNLARVRNDLLTAEEVADRLSIPTKRVYRLPMHRVELGPNTVRWRPEDLDGFIESHLVAA